MILTIDFTKSMQEFLRESESRAIIVAFVRYGAGAAPLDGLTDLMNARFPNMTNGQKIVAGKLMRRVCEELSFRHDQYDVDTKTPGCQFAKASTYTDDAQALQVAA
jgi:hypothetical protein